MLSRVADSLYWMSRYLERAEHTARVMGVHRNLMLEHDPAVERAAAGRACWLAWASQDQARRGCLRRGANLCAGADHRRIAAARENARQVREQISSEMWEQLNRLFHESKRIGTPESLPCAAATIWSFTVVQSSHLFQGVTDSTMTHGEGWQFIQAGRFIERVQAHRRADRFAFRRVLIRRRDGRRHEHMEWIGLLRSCTAFEAYCKVYTADLRPERVAEFLLLNPEFPHSVAIRRGPAAAARSKRFTRRPGRARPITLSKTGRAAYGVLELYAA